MSGCVRCVAHLLEDVKNIRQLFRANLLADFAKKTVWFGVLSMNSKPQNHLAALLSLQVAF